MNIYLQAQRLYNDLRISAEKDPSAKVPISIIETINSILKESKREKPKNTLLRKFTPLDPTATTYSQVLVLVGQIVTALEPVALPRTGGPTRKERLGI